MHDTRKDVSGTNLEFLTEMKHPDIEVWSMEN
jgi:hypothetical protein